MVLTLNAAPHSSTSSSKISILRPFSPIATHAAASYPPSSRGITSNAASFYFKSGEGSLPGHHATPWSLATISSSAPARAMSNTNTPCMYERHVPPRYSFNAQALERNAPPRTRSPVLPRFCSVAARGGSPPRHASLQYAPPRPYVLSRCILRSPCRPRMSICEH